MQQLTGKRERERQGGRAHTGRSGAELGRTSVQRSFIKSGVARSIGATPQRCQPGPAPEPEPEGSVAFHERSKERMASCHRPHPVPGGWHSSHAGQD
jgi:hypothetical protein